MKTTFKMPQLPKVKNQGPGNVHEEVPADLTSKMRDKLKNLMKTKSK